MITPNMEHLRYFVTVAEKGSFTAAGQTLRRDRSSVGQAIANLEIDLGITLFERNGRTIHLTPEGEVLYTRARTLLENYQSFCQFSTNLSADLESDLTIGVDSFVADRELAMLDTKLSKTFPSLRVHWKQFPTLELDAYLAKGDTDVNIRLFKNHDLPEEFHIQHIDNVNLVGLINRHALGQTTDLIKHSELRTIPLLLYPDLEAVFRHDRFENTCQQFSRSSALELLKQKAAWTLGSENDADEEIRTIHIDTPNPIVARRILVWHHGQPVGKAKRWLIDHTSFLFLPEVLR